MNPVNNEENTNEYQDESGKFSQGNPGRPKGSQNKFTTLKEAFLDAFNDERIEGVEGLIKWIAKSDRNRAMFYGWLTKMLPSNVVEGIGKEIKEAIQYISHIPKGEKEE